MTVEYAYTNIIGWPGVETARFLGQDKTKNEHARQRNEYILNKMKDLPKQKRKVKYVTTIAYIDENQKEYIIKGEIEGYISNTIRGENGFGFDEIFELENGKTLAELSKQEKNKISSRKIALEKLKEKILSSSTKTCISNDTKLNCNYG